MSMRVLSMAQFVEIFFAYSVATLLIPGLLLKEKLKELSFAERLTGYFLAGNFYCINLVFLLEFLHISCRVTLIFGTALPFLIRGYKKCSEVSFGRERFQKFLLGFKALLSGTYGVKTLLADITAWISDKIPEVKIKKIWKHIPELILCLAVVAGILYVYGLNNFTEYGYKESDMPVHNYWINLMDKNQIFKMGVYPHGFHCMIYYLHVVFGIKTYVLLRLFSLVQVLFIHLAIVGCLRMICKARFTPYIAAGLYLMANIFGKNTYSRYASALPQEYGMLFILPVVCFAVRFLDEYAAHLKETDEEKKQKKKRRSRWYMAGLAISFSLSLTTHFYDTMIAGYLCLGIAAGYFFRIFRWRYLRQVVLAGFVSILLAVIPMGIGVAMGNPLQGSLGWGLNVIKGKSTSDSSANAEVDKKVVTTESGKKITIVGDVDEETIEEIKKQVEKQADAASQDSASGQDSSDSGKASGVQQKSKTSEVMKLTTKEKVKGKFRIIFSEIQTYVTNENPFFAWCVIGGGAVLLVFGFFAFLLRRVDYGAMLLAMAVYTFIMCIMQSAGALGFPKLMDASRNSIFFAYTIVVIWALAADAAVYLLFGWFRRTWMMNLSSLLILVAAGCGIAEKGLVKEPVYVKALETNSAITCLTNIMNEEQDFTWTIVSANDELRMVEEDGYHYEILDFLKNIKKGEKAKTFTISTNAVYFFIEKIPVNYAGTADGMELGGISEKYAREPLPAENGIKAYEGRERWVTMSHMYYWGQKFMELYPNEMEVYYESDDFVCYRLKQNGNSLYNFAIDYGYNNPKVTTDRNAAKEKQEAK